MLKRIAVQQLRKGMFVQEFCGSWMDHPFWSKSIALDNDKDLKKILASSVTEVWIDTSKGLDVASETGQGASADAPEAAPAAPVSAARAPSAPVPLAEELQRARATCQRAKTAVTSMFQQARMGKAVDLEQAEPLVEEISASVMRNPGAFISLARLKDKDDYTYMHSVAVCALMVALGRQMQLDAPSLRQAGMAGLLHDLGKAAIPLDILNKPGKLTADEFTVVKGHPRAGYDLLREGGRAGETALDVCLHHHEKTDGTGYPDRLPGERISVFAKMGAICDVYDAVSSDRPYKAGWDPAESLRRMAEWSAGHFDEKMFHAFVKSLGIYPIGSLVKLQSGLLGVVVKQGEQSLLTPTVRAFYSAGQRQYVPTEDIDLGAPRARDRIVSRESAGEWKLGDVSRFWAGTEQTMR
jgi:HD-GYP domain-containing protein (c-di-GMP phosphodiesterase class II)